MLHDGDRCAEPPRDDEGVAEGDEPPPSAAATSRHDVRASASSEDVRLRGGVGADCAAPLAMAEDVAVAAAIDVCADPGAAVPGGEAAIDRIAARLAAAATVLEAEIARLSVRLVDDAAMRSLHERHCGIDATTDVLTFAAAEPHEPVDADVACCVDEAARQAARRGHAVDDELLLYALHGLLHCLGHDDRDPTGFAAMHAEEDRVLAAIGAAARFATPDREDPPAAAAAERNGAGSVGVDR